MSCHSILKVVSAAALALAASSQAHGQCSGAEPPSDFCTSARVLSGSPGMQYVRMDVSGATAFAETVCNAPVGHSVWFSIVPTVSGILTFSTCHSSTTYDTVAEAFSGGDSGCEFMTPVVCNDDTGASECANGCSAWGSVLKFVVTANQLYRFRVGSYNNNSAGCNLCLGVVVTLCDGETTPPETVISSPSPLSCLCPGAYDISGYVNDSGSGLASYTLDYAAVTGGGWTLITRGAGNVFGILGQWNVSGLSEGDYYLRLTARDGCGNSNSSVVTCHVNAAFDSLQLRSPTNGAVLGGVVVADGTVWDHCPPGALFAEWAPLGGAFSAFTASSPPWIVNDPLGTWNTRAGIPDGSYVVRVRGVTPCQSQAQATANVVIDNTAPTAVITSPLNCSRLNPGFVQVRGSVNDAHLASWVLQYSGGDTNGWVNINSGTSPIINGVLGNWDARGLRLCAYMLRIVATDSSVLDNNGALHNQREFTVAIDLGTSCTQDYNGDGLVNSQDFFDFLTIFFNGCP